MSIQSIIVLLLFAGALFYVGRMIYRSVFKKESGCANCKCGLDISELPLPKK